MKIAQQRPAALRRAADHLEARAEVEDRQTTHGTDQERRSHRARAYEYRGLAALKRSQAAAIEIHESEGAAS